MTDQEHPERPAPEALQQCLKTLQQLTDSADAVDDNTDEYAVFQAAQKLYKAVKKHRKYLRKQAEPRQEPTPEETSVRFVFPTPNDDTNDASSPERPATALADTALHEQPAEATQTEEAAEDEAPGRDVIQPPPAKPRRGKCYICNQRPDAFHETYASMCVPCGALNLQKRHQTIDLSQRVALLTGGRVKIGFQVGLKLLRSGAALIVTTRFPHDAARRYAAEPDFEAWSHRLQIYGQDLRHLPSLYELTDHLRQRYSKLDILIQNAAQTVRRPPSYYRHLMDFEQRPHEQLPPALQRVVARRDGPHQALPQLEANAGQGSTSTSLALVAPPAPGSLLRPIIQEATSMATGPSSAQLSQIPLLPEDEGHDEALFPTGIFDEDGQQEDRREQNSWTMQLTDVPGAELWEVHTINAMAPFLLLQRLTPLLQRADAQAHVIHVAAAEGQFGVPGRKSWRHPHTNMSKAALNMLTRTCADQYAAQGIYINSVDPGWVSYELPLRYVQEHARQGFRLPLDAVDGAARILDPIVKGLASGQPVYGHLLKDYRAVEW